MALVVLVGLPLGLLVRSATFAPGSRPWPSWASCSSWWWGPWVGRNLPCSATPWCWPRSTGRWWPEPTAPPPRPAPLMDGGARPAWPASRWRAPGRAVDHRRPGPARPGPTSPATRPRPPASAAARLGRVWNVYRPLQAAGPRSGHRPAGLGVPPGPLVLLRSGPGGPAGRGGVASAPIAPVPLRGLGRPLFGHRRPGLRGPPVRRRGRRGPGHAGRRGPGRGTHRCPSPLVAGPGRHSAHRAGGPA